MSRGPGRVERAIEEFFGECFDGECLASELSGAVFDVEWWEAEKKHKVSVLRAARKVAARIGWEECKNGDGIVFHRKGHAAYAPLSVMAKKYQELNRRIITKREAKASKEADRLMIAVHEAGHAVAGEAIGAQVTFATIVPKKRGAYTVEGRVRNAGCADALAEAFSYAMGPAAERAITGEFELPTSKTGTSDMDRMRHLLSDRRKDSPTIKLLLELACGFASANQDAIAAVATALLESPTLTGDEIREIIGKFEVDRRHLDQWIEQAERL